MSFFKKVKNFLGTGLGGVAGFLAGGPLGGLIGAGIGSTFDSARADNIAQNKMIENQNSLNMYAWNKQNEYNLPKNQMQRYIDAGLNPNLIYGSISNGNASNSVDLSAGVPGNNTQALAGVFGQAGNIASKVALHNLFLDMEQKQENINLTKANTKKVLGSVDNQGNNIRRTTGALGSVYNFGKELFSDFNNVYLHLPIGMGKAEKKINNKMFFDYQDGKLSKAQYIGFLERQYKNTGDKFYLRRLQIER